MAPKAKPAAKAPAKKPAATKKEKDSKKKDKTRSRSPEAEEVNASSSTVVEEALSDGDAPCSGVTGSPTPSPASQHLPPEKLAPIEPGEKTSAGGSATATPKKGQSPASSGRAPESDPALQSLLSEHEELRLKLMDTAAKLTDHLNRDPGRPPMTPQETLALLTTGSQIGFADAPQQQISITAPAESSASFSPSPTKSNANVLNPKLARTVPAQTRSAIHTNANSGGDPLNPDSLSNTWADSSNGFAKSSSMSPSRGKPRNLAPLDEQPGMNGTLHSVASTSGPLLTPGARRVEDARHALKSSVTSEAGGLENAILLKQVELSEAIEEWKTVRHDYINRHRAVSHSLAAKKEIDALRANHSSDMFRFRQEVKTVSARSEALEKHRMALHSKLRDAQQRLTLASVQRTPEEVRNLKKLEELNRTIALLKSEEASSKKEDTMLLESLKKHCTELQREIDRFDPVKYVDEQLHLQSGKEAFQRRNEREQLLKAMQAELISSPDPEVGAAKSNLKSKASASNLKRADASPSRHASQSKLKGGHPMEIDDSGIEGADSSVTSEVVASNRKNLQSFLSGGIL